MKAVVVAWLLAVVTLIGVALAVAFWDECTNRTGIEARYGSGGPALERGWRIVAFPGGGAYYCRPRLYRLFEY
jgi:hypothetical protein